MAKNTQAQTMPALSDSMKKLFTALRADKGATGEELRKILNRVWAPTQYQLKPIAEKVGMTLMTSPGKFFADGKMRYWFRTDAEVKAEQAADKVAEIAAKAAEKAEKAASKKIPAAANENAPAPDAKVAKAAKAAKTTKAAKKTPIVAKRAKKIANDDIIVAGAATITG